MSSTPTHPVHRASVSGEEMAVGLRVLSDLLAAGLPLVRALQAFEELAPPGWRPAVGAMRDAVRQGQGLASALELSPIVVPALVVGIVRAGEAGGGTAAAVRRAADHVEELEAARAALRAALAYPAAVAISGSAAIVLMVSVVLPRFERILGDLGQTLPWSTQVVLGAAHAVRAGAIPALALALVSVFAVRQALLDPVQRRRFDAFLLAIPLLGTLRLSLTTTRFCGALSALLESGVPLRLGLAQAGNVVQDEEIRARLEEGRAAIVAGAGIGRTFRELGIVTPTAARLAAAGEETGGLASMLAFASRLERGRADRTIRMLVRLIEPALIVCFAGVVALVAAALLQAVYSVRPS